MFRYWDIVLQRAPKTTLWGIFADVTFVIGFEIFSLVSAGSSNAEVSKNDIIWDVLINSYNV